MVKLEKVKKQYKDFELDCSMEIKEGYPILWMNRRRDWMLWQGNRFLIC